MSHTFARKPAVRCCAHKQGPQNGVQQNAHAVARVAMHRTYDKLHKSVYPISVDADLSEHRAPDRSLLDVRSVGCGVWTRAHVCMRVNHVGRSKLLVMIT